MDDGASTEEKKLLPRDRGREQETPRTETCALSDAYEPACPGGVARQQPPPGYLRVGASPGNVLKEAAATAGRLTARAVTEIIETLRGAGRGGCWARRSTG
jgi:hypothetical protein